MAYQELDSTISKEAEAMRNETRKLASEVLRPIGIEIDDYHDPADVIAKESNFWTAWKAYRKMNLHQMIIPNAFGGMADDIEPMARILISEELAYGDVGLAIGLETSAMPFSMAAMSPHPEVQNLAREYCEDAEANLIGCWCMMEPDHGSDWILTAQPGFDDPEKVGVPSLKAEKKGNEYILNGQKAAWVSNGTIATHAFVHLNLDPALGMRGDGIAIVPLELPGITRGKPLNKIGQRTLNQGEIFFDDVKLPEEYMVVPMAGMGTAMKDMVLVSANTHMGILFASVAQAAFDLALDYAKKRVQGGVPIFEHQNIKLKLFKMYTSVESARAYARRVAFYNGTTQPPSASHGISSKVLATETAFKVASEAIQIFGGNGLTKEYPIEKIFRDARASMIEDGENSVLSLSGASHL